MRTTELYPETMIDTSMREEKRTDGQTTMLDRQKTKEKKKKKKNHKQERPRIVPPYIYIYIGFIHSFHAADEKKHTSPRCCSEKDT
mmetsp:Transcript_43451/g.48356  ORF Transcript_43451/g.48356 Transcript_43451/m.48356 type:complete len:86 (-) Transcript_43451:471-728(-)